MHGAGGRVATRQSGGCLSWRSSNDKIFGREDEMRQIDQLVSSLNIGEDDSTSSSSGLLEIRGMAGSGKSSLIRHFPWKEKGWVLAAGKFDINKTVEPYSAIIEALDGLIEQWFLEEEKCQATILEEGEEENDETDKKRQTNLEKFRDLLRNDAHADILRNVIPRALVVGGVLTPRESRMEPDARKSLSFCTDGGGEGFICPHAFKGVFHRVISFLCSTRRVALFLDDIQWADEASLDMMESLVTSKNLIVDQGTGKGGLLLAASYREEEVNESHRVMERINNIKSSGVLAQTIHIKDLQVESLNSLVAYLVGHEPEETLPLATVIHQKTAGNPFFVLEFLTLLQYEKILNYNFIKFEWEWRDVQKIHTLANISDNVADVVAAAIQRLPAETQVILQVASCLGRKTVPVDLLGAYFTSLLSMPRHEIDDDIPVEILQKLNQEGGLEEALEIAVSNGILMNGDECQSSPTDMVVRQSTDLLKNRKWAHDKLLQFSYDMIPAKLRPKWHFRLGKILWTMSKSVMGQEWMLFTAADQLNRCNNFNTRNDGTASGDESDTKIDVARLNLEAAKLSMNKAALFPAMDMLRSAARQLKEHRKSEGPNENIWNAENYDLSLEIFSRLAEIGVKIGQHEDVMNAVHEVECNANCIDDKYRVHCAMLTSITSGNCRDYNLGIERGIQILRKYGQRINKRFWRFQLFVEKQKLKRNLPNGNLEELLTLPEMIDGRAAKVTKILLQYLWSFATFSPKYKPLRPLCTLRSLNIACQKGLNESAASAVVNYAIDLRAAGHYKEALKYGKFAIALADKFPQRMGSFHCQARLYATCSAFNTLISQSANLEGLLEAHTIGLKIGDTENAVLASMSYCWGYLSVGLPIGPLESDIVRYLKEAETLKVAYSIIVQFKIWQQTILNLQQITAQADADDKSKRLSTTTLTGDAMDQEDELKKLDGTGAKMTLRDINTARLMLACIYNDWDTAREMVDSLEEWLKFDVFITRDYFRTSYLGLGAFAFARQSEAKMTKKRYESLGRKALKYFQKDTSRGSVNAFPILTMLQAEESPSKEGYENAIRTCARLGLSHHEAYMCERAGEYFLNMNDQEWAKTYLDRAVSLYKDWGAKGKAIAMTKQYAHILTPNHDVRSSHNTALKGRRRFTRGRSRLLKSITGAVSFRGGTAFSSGSNHRGDTNTPIDNDTLASSVR